MAKPEREMTGFFWQSGTYTLVAGARSYELSNHLGNVLAVVSDRGELQSAQDFYPFGMAMPGRTWSASTEKYKYGFNGKETDPETGIQDYGMRWYLPNIARFPSVDPITKEYPELTPYQFASNRPIDGVDLDGLEFSKSTTIDNQGIMHIKITLRVSSGNLSETLTEEQAKVIFKRSQELFSTIIGTTCDEKRNIQYEGELIYDKNATIHFSLADDAKEENITGGNSTPGSAGVEATKFRKGKLELKDFDLTAADGVHELLHQGGLEHPAGDDNDAEDVALKKIDPSDVKSTDKVAQNNSFQSQPSTLVPDIYFNIMLYGWKIVDGKTVNDVRGSDKNATKVSPDQLNIIIQNIDKGKVNGEAVRRY